MNKRTFSAIIMFAFLYTITQAHASALTSDYAILLAQQTEVVPNTSTVLARASSAPASLAPTSLAPSPQVPSYTGALIRMLLALSAVLLLLLSVAWLLPKLLRANGQKGAFVGVHDSEIVIVASKTVSQGTMFHVISWRGVEYGVVNNQRGSASVTIMHPRPSDAGTKPSGSFEVRMSHKNLDETMILPVEGSGLGSRDGEGSGSGGANAANGGNAGRVGTPV